MDKLQRDMTLYGEYYNGVLFDRSLYSCYVFTKVLHKQNKIRQFGYLCTNKMIYIYEEVLDKYEHLLSNTVVYLDTPLEVCLKKQITRGRGWNWDSKKCQNI